MSRKKNSDTKTVQTRKRVQKHRRNNKFKKTYENAVQAEIRRQRNEEVRISESNLGSESHQSKNDSDLKTFNFKEELKSWTSKHRITRMAVSDLLKVLNIAGIIIKKLIDKFLN